MDLTLLLFIFVMICFFGLFFYERKGVRNFDPRIFEFGFPFIKRKEAWIYPLIVSDENHTSNGSYKIISPELLLFKTNDPLFSFRLRTMFPLKGKVEVKDGEAIITGKPPLAGVIFMLFWLSWWHAAGLALILESERVWLHGAIVIAVGWVTAIIIVIASFYIERRRFMSVLSEIKTILRTA